MNIRKMTAEQAAGYEWALARKEANDFWGEMLDTFHLGSIEMIAIQKYVELRIEQDAAERKLKEKGYSIQPGVEVFLADRAEASA